MLNWNEISKRERPLRLFRDQIARELPDMPCLEDSAPEEILEKAFALRRWAMSMANYCGREYLLPGFERLGFIEQARALAGYRCGVWCGDAAMWYVNVLRAFYIPAARFFYGHDVAGLGGLSHVTVIVGYNTGGPDQPYSFEFVIIDPYLGFHYEDAAGKLMPVHELIPHVIRGEYEAIWRVDTRLERPYLANPNEKHGFRGWLFPNNKQPIQGEVHGDRVVFQGASHSVGQLFPPGSPMWNLAAERRGDKPLDHYLLDLMLVRPRFEDILARSATEKEKVGDRYAEQEFFRRLAHAVMGAHA